MKETVNNSKVSQEYLDQMANDLKENLSKAFPAHIPFGCEEINAVGETLIINIVDADILGYTCGFSKEYDFDAINKEF